MDLNIEGEGFDTVGEFVYHRLGRIPIVGDETEMEGRTACASKGRTVLGRRIKKSRGREELPPPSDDNGCDHK